MASAEGALLLPEEWILLAFAVLPLLSLASHLLLEPVLEEHGCLSSNAEQPKTLADVEAFTDADAEEQRAAEEQQQPRLSQNALVRDFRDFEDEPIQRVKTFKRTKTRNREQKGPKPAAASTSSTPNMVSSSSVEDQTQSRNSSTPMMTRFKKSSFGSFFGASKS